jgi:hypothetical protein
MREVIIEGKKRKIHAAPLSAYIYEQAFGFDHDIHSDVNEFLTAKRGALTAPPAMPTLRLLYAFERTVDGYPAFSFDAWVKLQPREIFDDEALADAILDEVVECFFPRLAKARTDVESAGEGREAEGAADGAAMPEGSAPGVDGPESGTD